MTTPVLPFTPLRKPQPDLMRKWLEGDGFDLFFWRHLRGDFKRAKEFWHERCDEFLIQWTQDHPGSRPQLWWLHSSPEPRRRLGGVGEVDPMLPGLIYGVPKDWVGLSEADPPCFESEAAYLRRLHLFLPGESKRVPRTDFRPVFIRAREGVRCPITGTDTSGFGLFRT